MKPENRVGALMNNDRSCVFRTWSPSAKEVKLVLNIPEKIHPMMEEELGYWSVTLNGIEPGIQYFFQIDNRKKLPDPASRWQPQSVHGPSAVVDPNFAWTDDSWQGISLAEMIQYELHVGTFSKEGTFEG